MLAGRADGPWEDGLPYRGRYWLRTLGEHPRIGLSSATLGTSPAVHAEHAYATLTELLAATRTGTAATEQRHTFVPGSDAPHLSLPAGRTDVQLRKAMAAYDHVQMLRVTLSDADALLDCFESSKAASDMRALSNMVFTHEWCYRPFEMTSEWSAVERRGKPRKGDEPWCVWGFKQPQVPQACVINR